MKLSALFEEELPWRQPEDVDEPYSGGGLEGQHQKPWNKLAAKGPKGDDAFAPAGSLLSPGVKANIDKLASNLDFDALVEIIEKVTDKISELMRIDVDIDDPRVLKLIALKNYAYDVAQDQF